MERMTPDTTDFNSLSKKQLVELVIAKYNDCFRLEEENKNLKEKLEKTNELLGNVARCSEQYREKMVSVMEELKMFLYKD